MKLLTVNIYISGILFECTTFLSIIRLFITARKIVPCRSFVYNSLFFPLQHELHTGHGCCVGCFTCIGDRSKKCSASSIEENSQEFEGIWRHAIYEVIELESKATRYNAHIQQKWYFIPSPFFEYFFANPTREDTQPQEIPITKPATPAWDSIA